MIITHLGGGLGNQLFQYAIGRKMSLKNKDVFKLDISAYDVKNPRAYGLKHFNIIENIASPEEIKKIKLPYGQISRYIRGFKSRILRIKNIRFKPHVLNKNGDVYIDGFWQSEKYFIDIASTIRQDFKLRHKMGHSAEIAYEDIRKTAVPVSLHVRRGDYVQDKKTTQYHGGCSPEYYKKALDILKKKLGGDADGKIRLFVFSDDIEWVRKNMSFPYPTTFVSNPAIPDYEELILMSRCAHHIIANSSFSWWGAWLNPSSQKIVIAPERWFNTSQSIYRDVVPSSWIKI